MPTPPFSPYVYDRVKEAEEKLARNNVAVRRTQEVGCRISTNYLLSVSSSPGHVCGHDQAAPRQSSPGGGGRHLGAAGDHLQPGPARQPRSSGIYLDTISTISIRYLQYCTIISTQDTQDGDGRPVIDSKPQIRVRNPPGGKSSIFF